MFNKRLIKALQQQIKDQRQNYEDTSKGFIKALDDSTNQLMEVIIERDEFRLENNDLKAKLDANTGYEIMYQQQTEELKREQAAYADLKFRYNSLVDSKNKMVEETEKLYHRNQRQAKIIENHQAKEEELNHTIKMQKKEIEKLNIEVDSLNELLTKQQIQKGIEVPKLDFTREQLYQAFADKIEEQIYLVGQGINDPKHVDQVAETFNRLEKLYDRVEKNYNQVVSQ